MDEIPFPRMTPRQFQGCCASLGLGVTVVEMTDEYVVREWCGRTFFDSREPLAFSLPAVLWDRSGMYWVESAEKDGLGCKGELGGRNGMLSSSAFGLLYWLAWREPGMSEKKLVAALDENNVRHTYTSEPL